MTEPAYTAPDLSLFGDEHVRRYEETDGEEGYLWNGATILVLTTTGRKSGEPRKFALIYDSRGDDLVVVASKGGAPDHPGWYKNLLAHPDASVQVRGERFDVRARTAEGAERDELWRLMNRSWPNYDTYATRTDRVIPVVVLERR
ncbi:MAG TPA: nitroreductase family deazaflavin-dependent oxidoreductase [Acidimicrobiia bacterium]|nr:nitroreductase family deazaflavin-dependent oxidoreductase [Acidimicrobiia bacterium]